MKWTICIHSMMRKLIDAFFGARSVRALQGMVEESVDRWMWYFISDLWSKHEEEICWLCYCVVGDWESWEKMGRGRFTRFWPSRVLSVMVHVVLSFFLLCAFFCWERNSLLSNATRDQKQTKHRRNNETLIRAYLQPPRITRLRPLQPRIQSRSRHIRFRNEAFHLDLAHLICLTWALACCDRTRPRWFSWTSPRVCFLPPQFNPALSSSVGRDTLG